MLASFFDGHRQLFIRQRKGSAPERAVIFAAAISIDFDFFENNQGVRGLLDFS